MPHMAYFDQNTGATFNMDGSIKLKEEDITMKPKNSKSPAKKNLFNRISEKFKLGMKRSKN
jgi:hypothetical protein